ncbi:MAG: response regulator [Nannocystaceae bacterium]|nr:response regulator [Nannocystaceae bacterium]
MTEAGATATKTIRVLVVDDEVNLRVAIERRLRKAGMVTACASTTRHAIERLRADPYDVVLCDLRMPGGSGEELIRWLGSHSPTTRVIVISGYLTEEFVKTFPEGDNLRHVSKPFQFDDLIEQIEALGARKGFYGSSIEVELFDYVQMIALTGRDKVIEVLTPKGTGVIWFEHGDIVHVRYGDFRGETAFYHLLSVNRGTFQEAFWRDPPKRTIQRSSTHLLMEVARMADEGTLQKLAAHVLDETIVEAPTVIDGAVPIEIEDETSFESLNAMRRPRVPTLDDGDALDVAAVLAAENAAALRDAAPETAAPPVTSERSSVTTAAAFQRPGTMPKPKPASQPKRRTSPPVQEPSTLQPLGPSESGAGPIAGHAIFEDPDTRQVMLEQFWEFDGINGVAIISSTGKVLAEDMRNNSSMVTLAGFYMRGAARLARTLGYNVFDGVVARSMNGQQMVMVSMGAASAVLSVDVGRDPEAVRDAVMGVE